jgi:hypothetical protein
MTTAPTSAEITTINTFKLRESLAKSPSNGLLIKRGDFVKYTPSGSECTQPGAGESCSARLFGPWDGAGGVAQNQKSLRDRDAFSFLRFFGGTLDARLRTQIPSLAEKPVLT